MNAFDILIKRRNATNTGWEEVIATAQALSGLKLDSNEFPTFNGGQLAPTAVTGQNKTLTAAQVASGFIQDTVTTGAATDTLDTAAAIILALPQLATPGNSFSFILQNTAATALTITLAMGTGITAVTTLTTIPQNAAVRLQLISTSATTLALCLG